MAISSFGVYNNIEETIYFADSGIYRFYFTSKVYKKKFEERINEYISSEFDKLKNRYQIDKNECIEESIRTFLRFSLYKKIEKRGFRVYYKGDDSQWQRIQQ